MTTDKPAKREVCSECGLPRNVCCCDEIKGEQKKIREEHESETFFSNVGKMYDCPYAPGSACNQRKNLCDQGKFEVSCIMHIIRNINMGVHASHECLRKAGMEQSVLWLFDKGYIGKKYWNLSVNDIVKKIIEDEDYRKENVDR